MKTLRPQQDLCKNANRSFIHHSPKLDTAQMSINRGIKKQILYLYNGILLSITNYWYMSPRRWNSHKRESSHWLSHLYEVPEQAKLIYSEKTSELWLPAKGYVLRWLGNNRRELTGSKTFCSVVDRGLGCTDRRIYQSLSGDILKVVHFSLLYKYYHQKNAWTNIELKLMPMYAEIFRGKVHWCLQFTTKCIPKIRWTGQWIERFKHVETW